MMGKEWSDEEVELLMEEALKLKGKGLTVKEICKSFSISKKTYYNKLHEYERGLKNAQ
jgi:orotate phosphoribosyltransferase-like protein